MTKIGIITGSGLGASRVYEHAGLDVLLRDIDLNGLLRNSHIGMDPVPYYRDVVKWFRKRGVTHGSVGCNTFNDIGMQLFKEHGIEPIHSITEILFSEVRKYKTVGWISTSLFRNNLPVDLGVSLKHISESDQLIIDEIIFNELALGVLLGSSVKSIQKIVKSLACTDVVFRCTDLSLICDRIVDVHVIDSVQLHIQKFK